MDRLISENAVLDVINEAIRLGRFYSGKEQTIAEIKAIPKAEPYKGMTNGEVIKTLFNPKYEIDNLWKIVTTDIADETIFDFDWWFSPYKEEQESEDKE